VLENYINHVSFSNLDKYQKCPYQWYLRYIERHPDEAGDSAQIGKLGHLMIKAAIAGKIRPDLEAFNDLVIDIASGECSNLTLKERAEARELYQGYGASNITNLYEWVLFALDVRSKHKGRVELEKEVSCIIPGIPVPMQMHIDFISKDTIIDWKTGRNTEPVSSYQLGLYAYGYGKSKNINPSQFKRKFVFTGLEKQYEDKKPIQDALSWALSIYEQIEEDLEGYSFMGKGVFRKKEGTACRWCPYKETCFEENLGPVELINVPEEILTYAQAEEVARAILLMEEKLNVAQNALQVYCEENNLLMQTNGEYFGLFPGSVSRKWDKLTVYEAVKDLPAEEIIKIFNIDLRGINAMAKKNEAIAQVIQEAVTIETGKPKFKHASKPPKAS